MPICSHCGFEAEGADDARTALPDWEDPGVPFPRNLLGSWTRSLVDPVGFFRSVPFEAPVMRALLYLLIVTVASAAFSLWWSAVGADTGIPLEVFGYYEEALGDGMTAVVSFWVTPFAALALLAVWTLVLQFFALLLAPERRGPGATARVLCYAAGPTVFTLLPFLGPLIGTVWGLLLQVVGIREAHRTTTGRAVAIVFLPAVLFAAALLFMVLAMFLAVGYSGVA